MKKRAKVALILYIIFLISRCGDALATWYYTPDLALEGNTVALSIAGRNWFNLGLIQLIIIIFFAFCCQRLVKHDYSKPSFDEVIYNKLFNKDFSTDKKRYINESASIVSASMLGFSAVFLWISAHGLHYQWANNFLDLGAIQSMVIVLVFGYVLGVFIMKYVVKNYLKDDLPD